MLRPCCVMFIALVSLSACGHTYESVGRNPVTGALEHNKTEIGFTETVSVSEQCPPSASGRPSNCPAPPP